MVEKEKVEPERTKDGGQCVDLTVSSESWHRGGFPRWCSKRSPCTRPPLGSAGPKQARTSNLVTQVTARRHKKTPQNPARFFCYAYRRRFARAWSCCAACKLTPSAAPSSRQV